ncbi:hypothetical protein KAR91_73705 [Candidatus Pacearchaeota archaeon]|nr:hypothetical protein [Candidatus Pacearchaeota archaeon]
MTYKHSKNARNVFDIFKHACLLKAVQIKKPGVYFETHCGKASYQLPELWESSWMKVHRQNHCNIMLCDIDPEVGKTVDGMFPFKCGNGFYEATRYKADFYFIDPPYVMDSDWTNILTLTDKLNTWVVWYPIRKDLKLYLWPSIEMNWETDSDIIGCGMAFGGFSHGELSEIHDSMAFISKVLH